MSGILLVFRVIAFFVFAVFSGTGFSLILRFYEASAQEGAKGIRRPWSRDRVLRGLSAWARESGCNLGLLTRAPFGILPRGKLRPGVWLARENEVRTIEDSLVKSLTAVYHGRVKYPEHQTV